ncbi:odorant receptor 94a-like [Linepithema humile]|uniref:odorant receptor 94a-like n=1 Tax=Linepithema humile TaxID=83485 RepID=UPI00351DCAC1
MVTRIYMQRELVVQLIRQLNDILRVKDETMINIVKANVKPMEVPLKCYLAIGSLSAFIWCSLSLPLVFEKSTFYYVDYKMPVTYSKEPFSVNMFLLGTAMILLGNTYIFLKKVAVDVYTIYLVSLITSQYQYIALKLESIFQVRNVQNNCGDLPENYNSKTDFIVEQKIKLLCRQHNSVIHITLMLKKLLSLNFSLIYVNSVFRFCFIGIMLTKISASLLEGSMVILYGSGAIVQFYILCSSVQKLLEASTEITDKAFHKDWNQFGISVKRTFMLVMMASNNLEIKLSTFARFSLSLPSFMTVLNQAYSIALLLLRVK